MTTNTPPTEEQIRGVTGAENLLINADMTTRWNAATYPNPRRRFRVVFTVDGSRIEYINSKDPDYFPGYRTNGAI